MSVYNSLFGLSRDAFSMTPAPEFLYLSAAHEEALAGLVHALEARKSFAVLTGEVGTGKTILLNRLIQGLPANRVAFSYLVYPTVAPAEFLEFVLLGFGLRDFPSSKPQRLVKLREFLESACASGRISVLVVDEAHKLDVESLEEIRLLSNFEGPSGRLLQVVLSGQTELTTILNRFDLRQLKQRIEVRLSLRPLTEREAELYMRHRWRVASALKPFPFEDEAIRKIIDASQGIPRLINVLCDNTLVLAYAENSLSVSARHVVEATSDLWLTSGRTGAEWMDPEQECSTESASQVAGDPTPSQAEREYVQPPIPLPTLLRYMPPQPKSRGIGRWFHTSSAARPTEAEP